MVSSEVRPPSVLALGRRVGDVGLLRCRLLDRRRVLVLVVSAGGEADRGAEAERDGGGQRRAPACGSSSLMAAPFASPRDRSWVQATFPGHHDRTRRPHDLRRHRRLEQRRGAGGDDPRRARGAGGGRRARRRRQRLIGDGTRRVGRRAWLPRLSLSASREPGLRRGHQPGGRRRDQGPAGPAEPRRRAPARLSRGHRPPAHGGPRLGRLAGAGHRRGRNGPEHGRRRPALHRRRVGRRRRRPGSRRASSRTRCRSSRAPALRSRARPSSASAASTATTSSTTRTSTSRCACASREAASGLEPSAVVDHDYEFSADPGQVPLPRAQPLGDRAAHLPGPAARRGDAGDDRDRARPDGRRHGRAVGAA